MAPNFLSKFVKTNGTLSPNDGPPRARTISDVGHLRGRSSTSTVSGATDTNSTPPSVVVTTSNNNSPIQPSTPGSLHRSNSPRRARSASLTPSTPQRELQDVISIPQTTSPEGALPANPAMGLGIDLGQLPQLPEPALSHQSGLPKESSSNGFEHLIRRKLSTKSLKSLKNHQAQESAPSVPSTQEIEAPPKTMILVESPTSDSTPTTTTFPPPAEIDAIQPSTSTTSQASLQPRTRDSDAASISSAVSSNKKMPWRRGSVGSSKKRKPTGLASAIAASGLAMANPAVAQSLAQFAPQPNSPPRNQPQSPLHSSISHARRSSNASHGRSLTTQEENEQFYSDLSSGSEDELDLDDEIPVTGFAVASNKRNADFHDMFPQVPEGDYLIEDYGCALQREILIQGRLYISENHICFHANIFGWITDLIIPVYEIISIDKRMTALFIPNAIQITTRTAKYTFASFLSRDTTYDVIHNIWRLARPDAESIRSGDMSARVSLDDAVILREGGTSTTGTSLLSPLVNKTTECKCGRENTHYPETAMVAVFPGTPEKIYNLMFASGFIKDFMREEQNLKDLQISDWVPDPETNLLSRKFSYIKILNGVVKQTKCELVDETVHCDFENYISTLTTTRTPDVPSGGAFSVKTRTCIMWASVATTKVIVTTQVEWTGRSFIKSMINSSAIDGQKQYHADLERAMRKYIAEHLNEFVPEGMEDVVKSPIVVEAVGPSKQEESGVGGAPLSEEEASKRREHERNQRATQWAFDTCMGAWKVAKQSTLGALDLVSDAWDQSSSTTILYFVIVVLVLSNLWTLIMVGRREEVGRRKEKIKVDEQKKWVASIVAALTEERQLGPMRQSNEFLAKSVPTVGEDWALELGDLNRALDIVEDRVQYLRRSLQELD